eukprot:1665820-Amphidinium_carterae.1
MNIIIEEMQQTEHVVGLKDVFRVGMRGWLSLCLPVQERIPWVFPPWIDRAEQSPFFCISDRPCTRIQDKKGDIYIFRVCLRDVL